MSRMYIKDARVFSIAYAGLFSQHNLLVLWLFVINIISYHHVPCVSTDKAVILKPGNIVKCDVVVA